MDDGQVLDALERDDSYRLVRVLAQGPSGTTELVADAANSLYVRKRIPNELANRAAWEALQTAQSPHLPKVKDIYELPDTLVVVYQYVVGVTVAQLLARRVLVRPHEAADIAAGVCEAAAALHAQGVVHRDISPGNVVVSPNILGDSPRCRTFLIDLGVARVQSGAASHDTTTLGTRGFSAPEQYGFAQTDARSDVYSIGRLLLCLLVGSVPEEVSTDVSAYPTELVPEWLRAIIARSCAFEPSARYQSAAQMEAELLKAEAELGEGEVVPVAHAAGYKVEMPVLGVAQPAGKTRAANSKDTFFGQLARLISGQREPSRATSGPRPWGSVSIVWLCVFMLSWLFLSVGFDASCYTKQGDFIYYPLAGLVGCAGCVYAGHQTTSYLFKKGRYRMQKDARSLLMKILLTDVTLVLVATMFAAFLVSAVFSMQL